MIDQYHIERTWNLDRSFADDYNNVNTYPKFQEHLEKFKSMPILIFHFLII